MQKIKHGNYGKVAVTVSTNMNFNDRNSFLEDSIDRISNELESYIMSDVSDDAKVLADNIASGYAIQQSDTSIPLKDVDVRVYQSKASWQIAAYGPDLLYREFGTGQRGLEDPYPDSSVLMEYNWKYGSGPRVLHAGTWASGNINAEKIPGWYKSALKGTSKNFPKISKKDYVWLAPSAKTRKRPDASSRNMTHGLEPGRVWYDAWSDFEASYGIDEYYTAGLAKIEPRLTPKKLMIRIKDVFKGEK